MSSWRRRLGARHASTPSQSGGGGACCRGGVWGARVASGCTAVGRWRASAPRFALLKQLAREAANRRRFPTRSSDLPECGASAPLIACQLLCLATLLCYGELLTVSKCPSLKYGDGRAWGQKLQESLAKAPKRAPWPRGSPPRPKLGFGDASGGKSLATGRRSFTRCDRSRQ